MRLGLFERQAQRLCGAVVEDRVVDLGQFPTFSAIVTPAAVLEAALSRDNTDRQALHNWIDDQIRSERAIQAGALQPLPPHIPGRKIICQVVNYTDHGEESNIQPPSQPFFFLKPSSSVAGQGSPILLHDASKKTDFECELAVVIGTPGRNIAPHDAMQHVFGYTILNDVSYRDLQFNERAPELNDWFGRNWFKGKGLDNGCLLGPWVTSADAIGDPYSLRIECWVNGRLRQSDSTDSMRIRIPELIAEASLGCTLQSGDIIATGTPAGVGLGDGEYLEPGDSVVSVISRLGRLENVVRSSDDAMTDITSQ